MWPRTQKNRESLALLDTQSETAEVLAGIHYLDEEYIVPDFIDSTLTDASHYLIETIPGFHGVVNVGGTANGSYELRRQKNPNAITDLDFYFIGNNSTLPYLDAASEYITSSITPYKMLPDGVLNGKNPNNFLNLDRINESIDNGDTNLLALPFQSMYGNVNEAKQAVLTSLLQRDNTQEIWDEVASYHIQSLSLHHGTFPADFSTEIMDEYYPQKVQKYELPVTVEEALAELSHSD